MRSARLKNWVEMAKKAMAVAPFFLPAIVLIVSLVGSSLGGGPGHFIGPPPGSTPPPSGNGGGELFVTIHTADETEFNAGTGQMSVETTFAQNQAPTLSPNPLNRTTAKNTPTAFILPATDPQSDLIIPTLANEPLASGATVTVSPTLLLSYTPAPGFTGVDKVLVRLSNPDGTNTVVTVLITVTP